MTYLGRSHRRDAALASGAAGSAGSRHPVARADRYVPALTAIFDVASCHRSRSVHA